MSSTAAGNAAKTTLLTSSRRLGASRIVGGDVTPATRPGSGPWRRPPARWTHAAKWRPVQVLDEWVAKEARPISLRQLMVFGRSLTEQRLISSANYVRTELPVRIAHRLRDMQRLPYAVVTNPHMSDVYELYYNAFNTFRRVREVKSLEDNDGLCDEIAAMLRAHLPVIPKLAMGILECDGRMDGAELDRFMNTVLRSRISRRVIAQQHLALTESFHAPPPPPDAAASESEFIGEVFLKCAARDVVERCGAAVQALARDANGPDANGPDAAIPEIRVDGHLGATFPYILSHLEYIVGELLRNSVQAVIDHHQRRRGGGPSDSNSSSSSSNQYSPPPPIEVTICEAPQHVIIRVSDQGGGVPRDVLPHLWSFGGSGPRSTSQKLENLVQVPLMAATLQELRVDGKSPGPPPHLAHANPPPGPNRSNNGGVAGVDGSRPRVAARDSSLSSLSMRPPNLRLGMGLPLSRVYAEYWAGSLEVHSLEGYGVDAFLQISKLGNKNEQLATRATMDAV